MLGKRKKELSDFERLKLEVLWLRVAALSSSPEFAEKYWELLGTLRRDPNIVLDEELSEFLNDHIQELRKYVAEPDIW